jgi:hypothetical protein
MICFRLLSEYFLGEIEEDCDKAEVMTSSLIVGWNRLNPEHECVTSTSYPELA